MLQEALKILDIQEEELLGLKSTDPKKGAVAWLLKKNTTVEVVWIAERLRMGHRTSASRSVSRFDQSMDKEQVTIKQKMLQITG